MQLEQIQEETPSETGGGRTLGETQKRTPGETGG